MSIDFTLSQQHIKTIRQNFTCLRQEMFVGADLLSYLYQHEILTRSQCQSLLALRGEMQRANDKLLTFVMRMSAEQFEVFLAGLEETNQPHVVKMMRGQETGSRGIYKCVLYYMNYIYYVPFSEKSGHIVTGVFSFHFFPFIPTLITAISRKPLGRFSQNLTWDISMDGKML